jgi:hypothetical protein
MPSNNYIYKMSNAGGMSTLTRYTDMLAGNAAYVPIFGAYDSIATVTVGSGGTGTVTFSSIPQTYTHLQIRLIGQISSFEAFLYTFNSDSSASYTRHRLLGNGTSASAGNSYGNTSGAILPGAGFPTTANIFGAVVMDILDYTNTNKYKTVKALGGYDANGSGAFEIDSNLWMNTTAINSITIVPGAGNITQYSSFALYGIKGA